jgi:hypothetical protein
MGNRVSEYQDLSSMNYSQFLFSCAQVMFPVPCSLSVPHCLLPTPHSLILR